ncbi:MAG: glutamate-5-semialdehyde dehydrogenase [Alphaproteobacteria bacterium]|nr:glutamate-5-semialdehyde dehydrogenase [Alphaproteobacteria bacterium]
MHDLGARARAAARVLALAPRARKDAALMAMAESIRAQSNSILAANAADMDAARAKGLSSAMTDRLLLTPERIEGIRAGLAVVAGLEDPVGTVLADWTRPNGLRIRRVRMPLGVVGIIFESRPNVTVDAGALCLKAGNAAILRAGSEALGSARALHAAMQAGLAEADLPEDAILLVPTPDRDAVGLMLSAMTDSIDVIVPRGGKSLVARVQDEARVPVLAHLEGICHVYVDRDAELAKARAIVLNAKMRRTGICGAAETLLIDRAALDTHLLPVLEDLAAAGCEIRGDAEVRRRFPAARAASEADWRTEYLDAILSVAVVDGVGGALAHITRYGSSHTEAIITENAATAERFLSECDSAIVLHNASTQFADGGEFGFGAEIGIATGRLHARGPVGVEQLTTFKYVVHGTGQIRP